MDRPGKYLSFYLSIYLSTTWRFCFAECSTQCSSSFFDDRRMLQKGHFNIGGTPIKASELPEASYNLQINGCLADHEGGLQIENQETRKNEFLKIELELKRILV